MQYSTPSRGRSMLLCASNVVQLTKAQHSPFDGTDQHSEHPFPRHTPEKDKTWMLIGIATGIHTCINRPCGRQKGTATSVVTAHECFPTLCRQIQARPLKKLRSTRGAGKGITIRGESSPLPAVLACCSSSCASVRLSTVLSRHTYSEESISTLAVASVPLVVGTADCILPASTV